MGTLLAILDEDDNFLTDPPIVSCTALLIPIERYDDLRLGLIRLLRPETEPEPQTMVPRPILHFQNLLPDATDARRLAVLVGLVQLVRSCSGKVYRAGYFSPPALVERFSHSGSKANGRHSLLTLLVQGILGGLSSDHPDDHVVVVVDGAFDRGFRPVHQAYSGSEPVTQAMRALWGDGSLIRPMHLMAGPFYADSDHCEAVEVVDVVAGLLRLLATRRVCPDYPFSQHKLDMLAIAKTLDDLVVADQLTSMRFDGVAQGLTEFACSDGDPPPRARIPDSH
jgi:hypothetical protein